MNRDMFSDADLQRFWLKVQKIADGCWKWLGTPEQDGYGTFKIRRLIGGDHGQTFRAHRVSYMLHHGSIDPNLTVDHLCRNRICVRPDHLEQVTSRENTLRGGNAAKTHCMRGHELSGENLCVDPVDGHRGCRECRRLAMERWTRDPSKQYQTHCKHGHEFTERTAYVARNGVRYCRVCKRRGGGNVKTMLLEEV